jgi:hypothetical protein
MDAFKKKSEDDERKSVILLSLLLAGLVFVLYWRAIWFDFIELDDNLYLLENSKIKLGLSWESIQWAMTTFHTTNWHPLTWFFLLAEYELFGFAPSGYHIVGIVLHGINTVLLFIVMYRMTKETGKSAAVAALFAVHPLNIESVVWIAERKNLLSTLFWILTVWSYLRYTERPGRERYLIAIFLFALGLMSKPMLVSLPFVLFMLDYWPLRRILPDDRGIEKKNLRRKDVAEVIRLLLEKIPFFVLSFLSVLITIYAAKTGGAAKSLLAFPLSIRIENAALSYFSYLGMLITPVNLSIFYPYPRPIAFGCVMAAFLFLLAATVFVIFKIREYRYLAVGWFWYLVTLLPVIGILQVGLQSMANRYLYIPFIGIFIIIIWVICDIFKESQKLKYVSYVIIVALIVYFGFVTSYELPHWKNSETAFARALEVTENNHIAALGIGNVMLKKGDLEMAKKNFRESLRIKPDYELAHNNLGLTLMRSGELKEAGIHFREAIKYDSLFARAYNNLGDLLVKEGKTEEAKRFFEKAIALNPDYDSPRENLSLLIKTSKEKKSENKK